MREAQAEAATFGMADPIDAATELRHELVRNCDLAGAGYRTASAEAFGVVEHPAICLSFGDCRILFFGKRRTPDKGRSGLIIF